MDRAYYLGGEFIDAISKNVSELDDFTYNLDQDLRHCQSVNELRKFNSTAAIVIPKAKKCINKKVEEYYWWRTSTMTPVTEAATNATTEVVREVSTV